MFHASTERLIEYWRSRKGSALAPSRAAIDPSDFPKLLPQAFILGRRGPGDYAFRLAGGLLSQLHRRDLRGVSFSELWTSSDRIAVQTALEGARRRGEATVIYAEAQAGLAAVAMEILVAPLANPDGEIGRMLGLYQPISPIDILRGGAVSHLVLDGVTKAVAPANEDGPRVRLASVQGRLVSHGQTTATVAHSG